MRVVTLRILLMTILLGAPAALAWQDHAASEPSSPRDTPAFMWGEGARDASRVILNAYPVLATTDVNPNAALAPGAVAFPAMQWRATLGIWRDCNGDGHVGHAAVPGFAYAPALLDDAGAAACPEGGLHRADLRVIELVTIAPPHATRPGAAGIVMMDAAVWGDAWRDLVASPPCRVSPLPPGATSRTGVVLGALDCVLGGLVVDGVDAADPDGALGLRFGGAPERSASALNADLPLHPYRNPYTGESGLLDERDAEPAFVAWDCETRAPAPELRDPRGSWWMAAERAWDGAADDCDPATPSELSGWHVDLEPDIEYSPWVRTRTDVVFEFGRFGASTVTGAEPPTWEAPNLMLAANPALRTSDMRAAAPQEWRFHARVDPTALEALGAALPGGGASWTYGAESCPWTGASEEPWACDPSQWYFTERLRGEPLGPLPGDTYHLRDVDCLGVRGCP